MRTRITFALHELVATLKAFADSRLQRDHGISAGDFVYLGTIAEQQPIDVTSLAHCLVITKAAVSKRLPHLVECGWASTTPGPGRRVLISLTDAGAELVEDAGGRIDADVLALFADPRFADSSLDPAVLGPQLELLTQLIREKETP